MRHLRPVEPMYRPAERPAPSRPRRRVIIPRQPRAAWRWRPDSPGEAWAAFCWRHRWARVLNDLGIVVLLTAAICFLLYAAFTPATPIHTQGGVP